MTITINLEAASEVANSTLSPVQGAGNYMYKLIYDSQSSNEQLEQCISANNCSELIKRTNSTYPYAEVYISVAAGTIDFNSHNFKVMKTVLSTLNFNASQASNQSSTSNSTSSSGGNYAPGNTSNPAVVANQCYKLDNLRGTNFGNGKGYPVSAINAATQSLTLSYTVGSSQAETRTFSVPSSAAIVGGTDCTSIPFSKIKVNDLVTVYLDKTSTVTYVDDHN
jgi:hypothetical protein